MKISTSQAGEILSLSISGINDLVKRKLLKDYGVTKNGGKKHLIKLDAKEVRAFKKGYKKRLHKNVSSIEVINEMPNKPMNGLMTRLGNIETKLDLLLRMWQ